MLESYEVILFILYLIGLVILIAMYVYKRKSLSESMRTDAVLAIAMYPMLLLLLAVIGPFVAVVTTLDWLAKL